MRVARLVGGGRWSSTRFLLAYMGASGFLLLYAMRVNISVAIVDMVQPVQSRPIAFLSDAEECPLPESSGEDTSSQSNHDFNWDEKEVAEVLAAFYYGYIFTQILGGYLATQYGGKWVFSSGILTTSILTILTPYAAYSGGSSALVFVRFLEGVFEAVTFPAFNAMMGKWVPLFEKSLFSSLSHSGATFGNVICQPIMGYLCSLPYMGGWPLGFYVFGILGVVHFIVWSFVVSSSPSEHPTISPSELDFIKKNTQPSTNVQPRMPWQAALTSPAVWAIMVAHFCTNWAVYGLMTLLPQYLSNVLHYDIKSNGLVCAIPWLCCYISIQCVSHWTDHVRQTGQLSTTRVRKLNMWCGSLIPATFLLLAGYAGCDWLMAVFCITCAVTGLGFCFSAYKCNHLDIAPQFAGTLFGVTNTVATIPGFLAPLVARSITSGNPHSRVVWQNVFILIAVIQVIGAAVYECFASGEVQPWAAGSGPGRKKSDSSYKLLVDQ